MKEVKNLNLIVDSLDVLCEPVTGGPLIEKNGKLVSASGKEYEINDDIPNLVLITDKEKNRYALDLFKNKAAIYDEHQHLSFETFYQKEEDVRNQLISKLNLERKNIKVLELNAGTGRDTVLIKQKLSTDSKLYAQDISLDMLKILKLKEKDIFLTQSNGEALPYKSDSFDAIYSFGGVGMEIYSDIRGQMQEICRVAKKGAKVVIGGIGMAEWLCESEFGKILINHNAHYKNHFDLAMLPVEVRNVNMSWILNGAGFCLEFEVGEGEPEADFDFDIPGVRGGTLRTRYYGKLEGVSPETKRVIYEAREKLGISMYDFLNEVLQKSAKDILKGENKDEVD